MQKSFQFSSFENIQFFIFFFFCRNEKLKNCQIYSRRSKTTFFLFFYVKKRKEDEKKAEQAYPLGRRHFFFCFSQSKFIHFFHFLFVFVSPMRILIFTQKFYLERKSDSFFLISHTTSKMKSRV